MAGITNVDSEKTVAGTQRPLSKARQTVRAQARRVQEIKLSKNEQLTRSSSLASQSADTSLIERLREFRTRQGSEPLPEVLQKMLEIQKTRDLQEAAEITVRMKLESDERLYPHSLHRLVKRCEDPEWAGWEIPTVCEIAKKMEQEQNK